MNQQQSTQDCEHKIAYQSIEEARAADTANSHRYSKPRLSIYKCGKCGLFHLTHRSDDD